MAAIVDLRQVDVSSPDVLIVTTTQGSEITFATQDMERQLRRWHEIYNEGQRISKAIATLDLAVPQLHSGPLGRCQRAGAARRSKEKRTCNVIGGEMFDPDSLIVGLEIGTSKVCAVVGEVNAAGVLNLIGLGQARSRGVRKGEIADAALIQEDVRNAIVEAEQMANVEIRSVYLGVTGSHIRGFNNRGVHPVVSADREITEEDVQDVIKNAKAINIQKENIVVHAIRQHFHVDEQDGIVNPVGMLGTMVGVDMHVVHGNFNRLQNPIRIVKGLQLEVEIHCVQRPRRVARLADDRPEGKARARDGSRRRHDQLRGLYRRHHQTHRRPRGGRRLACLQRPRLRFETAAGTRRALENRKRFRARRGGNQKARPCHALERGGMPVKTINLEHLRRIMSLRLEEIFQSDRTGSRQGAHLLDYLRAGVFLCGGGSRIPNIHKLAEKVFQLPATPGKTTHISGLKAALDQPEFATAIGLVKYGSFQQKKRTGGFFGDGIKKTFSEIFNRK